MNIVVYCSACSNLPQEVIDIATALGQWIGQGGHTLVYGGVNAGLMHVTAQAAVHAGCKSVMGIVPEIFQHRADPLCTKLILATDLNHRKAKLIAGGDVFVVLPGGLGTIDEWVSTLSQLVVEGSDRPVIVVNYHGMFSAQAQQLCVTAQSPFARASGIDRSILVGTSQELITQLSKLL